MSEQPIVVWSEIPVTDMDRSVAFYSSVFDYKMTIDTTGSNPMAILNGTMNGVGGHLYPGKPAKNSGPTLHLAVPGDLEEAIDKCRNAGGEIIGEVHQIPPGRFIYATDPDGNSLGLFEPAG